MQYTNPVEDPYAIFSLPTPLKRPRSPPLPIQPRPSTSVLVPEHEHAAADEDGEHKKKKRVVKPREVPEGVIVTDKSCARCRERKVKCDRVPPVCKHCKDRNESCDLGFLIPKEKSKVSGEEAARIAKLERRLAELESQLVVPPTTTNRSSSPSSSTPTAFAASGDVFAFLTQSPDSEGSPPVTSNIGQSSLDWRLATPQMEQSLSQHLCDSFFESCCFILPSFNYFRGRVDDYRMDTRKLAGWDKASIAAFCAVGARASPHSVRLYLLFLALLGISQSTVTASMLSAGARRQSACMKLLARAHEIAFKEGVEDEPKIENLASLLALFQMTSFVELEPKKSRSLLRGALGHFKDLQDAAVSDSEKAELKRMFAYAIYIGDAQTSAYARKPSLISPSDLKTYFDHTGIVIPALPSTSLIPVLGKVLGGGVEDRNLRTAVHLVGCWTAACQRMWVSIAAPANKTAEGLAVSVPALWASIDGTRSAIQYLQSIIFNSASPPVAHTHSHDGGSGHFHDTDYVAMVIRSDRDLCDLVAMAHAMLVGLEEEKLDGLEPLRREGESRARKVLKSLAFYFKIYITGADMHMIYHAVFQMEFNPQWTEMALQRVGEPGGPLDESEEVSLTELGWFIEGLQHALYYTPSAERRLAELSPRFTDLDEPSTTASLPSPLPLSPYNDYFADFETDSTGTTTTSTSALFGPPGVEPVVDYSLGGLGMGTGGDSSLAFDFDMFGSSFVQQ